jgi:hypothetical protein
MTKCANFRYGCQCDSWNGMIGEYCCKTCRNGQTCSTRVHIFRSVGSTAINSCIHCKQPSSLCPCMNGSYRATYGKFICFNEINRGQFGGDYYKHKCKKYDNKIKNLKIIIAK